jgi:hypothetical protein
MADPDPPKKSAGVFFADAAEGPTAAEAENYARARREAVNVWAERHPGAQAARCGARVLEGGEGRAVVGLRFLGRDIRVAWPDGRVSDAETGDELPLWEQVIVLHYLSGTGEVPVGGKWIGFAQVPGAAFYAPAFQQRTNVPLAQTFGDDPKRLLEAGRPLDAETYDLGDAALIVQVLPKLPMAVVIHGGDEEFPADAKLLYDMTVSDYLDLEDIAVLGGLLVGRLIRADPGGET